VYAIERGIKLSPYGSWTLKHAPKEAAAEPDECYLVGEDQSRDVPDLAIEVIWTSGGIGKLEIYRRLGVKEVWVWRDGRVGVHVLRGDDYEQVGASGVFPGLDLALLVSFLDRPTATEAMQAFRAALSHAG
jgi:Uma2 family endonuclease